MFNFWTILFWVFAIWLWTRHGRDRDRRRREEESRRVNAGYAILRGFGRMLGLMSKADGRISKTEVDVASRCLRSMGLSEAEYQICAGAFNEVREYSFYAFSQCASQFASVVAEETRMLVYEMLWTVAAADGVLDGREDELLRAAVGPLGIDPISYHYFKRMYFGDGGGGADDGSRRESELEKAYARLGCSPSDSDDAVRAAYRRLAMRYHPDRLKVEGVPEGMIAQATRSMAEINAAWEIVRKQRNI